MRVSLVVVAALLAVGSLSASRAADVTLRANRRLLSSVSATPTATAPSDDKKQQQPPATLQTTAQQPIQAAQPAKPAQPAQPAKPAQPTQQPSATTPAVIPAMPLAAGLGQEEEGDEEPTVVLVAVDEAGEPGAEEGDEGEEDEVDFVPQAAGGAGVTEAGPGSDDDDDDEEGEPEAGPGGKGEPCDDGPAAAGQGKPGPAQAGPGSAPGAGGPRCVTLDGNNLPNGRLCTAQLVTVTTPTCKDYKAGCLKSTSQLLVPAGTATDNPGDYNLSAQAACKLLGYAAPGSGSVHMSGTSPAAQQLCYNGQDWSKGNWWSVLVCCA